MHCMGMNMIKHKTRIPLRILISNNVTLYVLMPGRPHERSPEMTVILNT